MVHQVSFTSREELSRCGVMVTKSFQILVPGGSKWEIHFRYAASLIGRAEAKNYARVYILSEFNVEDVAFFANPKTIDNSFYSVFFTDWR